MVCWQPPSDDYQPIIKEKNPKSNFVEDRPAHRNKKMNFNFEEDRLKSFNGWSNKYVEKHILAKTGFYYLGVKDHVRCQFCRICVGDWEKNDDEIKEHLKWSPHCPLLRSKTTRNVKFENASRLSYLLKRINADTDLGYDTVDGI